MKNVLALTTSALLAAVAFATGPDLKHEHAGDVFQRLHRKQCYLDGPASNGTSKGEYQTIDGVDLYISYPPRYKNGSTSTPAIIYLTDIFGVQLLNNRLLADAFSRAGYLTLIPDLFRGDPVPADALSNPTSPFNLTAWQQRHPQSEIESIITSTLHTTTTHFSIPATRLGGVGYCFGGKYIARYLSSSSAARPISLAAGFTAHPSNTLSAEWSSIAHPIAIAFGELDASNTPENRSTIEGIFIAENKTFQTTLYANAEHGFAVRTNLSDPQKRFAQEGAYLQAVRWLDEWVKGEE